MSPPFLFMSRTFTPPRSSSAASARGTSRPTGFPKIALVGRSNVGKSTLINALVRKDIARTSSTPGKTRLVNIYRIAAALTGAFYLVDLPGYGHADGGPKARDEFAALTTAYFAARSTAGLKARPTAEQARPTDALEPSLAPPSTSPVATVHLCARPSLPSTRAIPVSTETSKPCTGSQRLACRRCWWQRRLTNSRSPTAQSSNASANGPSASRRLPSRQ